MPDTDGQIRISLIGDDEAGPDLAATFARVRADIDRLPNLYRTLGHNPAILDAWLAFAWPLRNAARTERALRELIIMRTAQLHTADYEWRQHWVMALEAGVNEAQLGALAEWPTAPEFSAAERAALRMTDELGSRADIADSTWSALRAHFAEDECVELVLTASFYACVSRVLNGLRVPLEADARARPAVDPGAAEPRS